MLRNYYNIRTAALFGSDCIIIIIHKYIHTYKNNRDSYRECILYCSYYVKQRLQMIIIHIQS